MLIPTCTDVLNNSIICKYCALNNCFFYNPKSEKSWDSMENANKKESSDF